MKKGILVLALVMVVTGGIFAQNGYIKPTFSLGFANTSYPKVSISETALALDVDFVTSIGLTFGLETVMAWNSDQTDGLTIFGLGYTYTTEVWSIGGKLMAVPAIAVGGGMGINANGTWWFKENLGLTGIVDLYFGMGDVDWTMFSLRIGISAKI